MAYDDKCFDLAEHFLIDRTFPSAKDRIEAAKSLAAAIQSAVEDWFDDVDNR